MEFEPDPRRFKVVCQRCGKTGEVDFKKPLGEMGWHLMFWDYDTEDGYTFTIEYYLCDECYYELYGEEIERAKKLAEEERRLEEGL